MIRFLTPERRLIEIRKLPETLREWRAGTHRVVDETGRETGELVDEPKDFKTMQMEREQAADIIEGLLSTVEARDARIAQLERK